MADQEDATMEGVQEGPPTEILADVEMPSVPAIPAPPTQGSAGSATAAASSIVSSKEFIEAKKIAAVAGISEEKAATLVLGGNNLDNLLECDETGLRTLVEQNNLTVNFVPNILKVKFLFNNLSPGFEKYAAAIHVANMRKEIPSLEYCIRNDIFWDSFVEQFALFDLTPPKAEAREEFWKALEYAVEKFKEQAAASRDEVCINAGPCCSQEEAAAIEKFIDVARAQNIQNCARFIENSFPEFPVVLACAPSGSGKTQTSFALTECPRLIISKAKRSQYVNNAAIRLHRALWTCLHRDLAGIELSFNNLLTQVEENIWTAGFLLYIYEQTEGMDTANIARWCAGKPAAATVGNPERQLSSNRISFPKKSIEELKARYAGRFFAVDEIDAKSDHLRLLRNICRVAEIRIVLMGTDASASNYIEKAEDSRGEGILMKPAPWTRIIRHLASFSPNDVQILTLSSVNVDFRGMVLQSNPLFASLAIEKLQALKNFDRTNLQACLACVIPEVAREIEIRKLAFYGNRNGQIAMHLAAHHAVCLESSLVHSHFATLHLQPNDSDPEKDRESLLMYEGQWYDLILSAERLSCLNCRIRPSSKYYGAQKDPLMYLVLDQCGLGQTTASAFKSNSTFFFPPSSGFNPDARKNSGDELEAIATVAAAIASHKNCVNGTSFDDYLRNYWMELQAIDNSDAPMWRTGSLPSQLLADLRNIVIPHLFGPGSRLGGPIGVVDFLGFIERCKDALGFDFLFKLVRSLLEFRGECKNYKAAISGEVLYGCIRRAWKGLTSKQPARVLFVITNRLKDTYFSGYSKMATAFSTTQIYRDQTAVMKIVFNPNDRTLSLENMRSDGIVPFQPRLIVIAIERFFDEKKFNEWTSMGLPGLGEEPANVECEYPTEEDVERSLCEQSQ